MGGLITGQNGLGWEKSTLSVNLVTLLTSNRSNNRIDIREQAKQSKRAKYGESRLKYIFKTCNFIKKSFKDMKH